MGAKPSKISASRGAAVLGKSKWSTPLDTWIKIMSEEKPDVLAALGFSPPVREDKALFRWGHAFEDAICKLAGNAQNGEVTSRELFSMHDDLLFVTCHQDGEHCESVLHEGKTVFERAFRESWGEPGTDHVKDVYQYQCQQQMACTGAEQVIISALVFPRPVDDWEAEGTVATKIERLYADPHWVLRTEFEDVDPQVWADQLANMGYFHQYFINRNESLIDKMLEKYAAWWEAYIVGETPPPAQTVDDFKNLITSPIGTVVASKHIETISALDKALAEEIKLANTKRAAFRTTIGNYMEDELSGATLDDDSREKIVLRDTKGQKIRTYSKKGGLR